MLSSGAAAISSVIHTSQGSSFWRSASIIWMKKKCNKRSMKVLYGIHFSMDQRTMKGLHAYYCAL